MTQRIFWWFSFLFLCGLIACGISGLVTTGKFGKLVRAVQCAYERIYYDSQYGQLKDTFPRWEGLKNNSLKLKESQNVLNITIPSSNFCYDDNWETDALYFEGNEKFKLYKFKGKYYKPFINEMRKILEECNDRNSPLYSGKDLFYNNDKPNDPKSIVGSYIYKINEVMNQISAKCEDIEDSLTNLNQYGTLYSEQLKETINNFEKISEDLNNYDTVFLDKVRYYIKVAKGCGYILVIIYLCLVNLFAFFGIILLMAYTFLKNQGSLDTLMHIVWNVIKFFVFSFFMYGGAFGMLYLGLRDAIGYSMYLFGENLNQNKTTYLLPEEESKNFLWFCLNEEKTDFTSELDSSFSGDLNEFYTNYGSLKNILKSDTNIDSFKEYQISTSPTRNLESFPDTTDIETEDDYSDISDFLTEDMSGYIRDSIDFFYSNVQFNKMINNIKIKIGELPEVNLVNNEGNFLDSFDCGFLKNDVSMVYNTLYDLSIESRILCAISCFIGFFGEIVVYFYILSIYHYNNTIFKEGNRDINHRNHNNRNVEISSRNEFLDKKRPIDMKKYNQKLDLDFSP